MIAIDLKPEYEKLITDEATRRGVPVDDLVQEAIVRMIEDIEDIAAAEEALRDYDPSLNVSLEEVKRRLGLDE